MSLFTEKEKRELKDKGNFVLMMYLIWFFGAADAYLSLKFGFNPLFNEVVEPKMAFMLVFTLLVEVGVVMLLFRKYFKVNKKK